MAENDDLFKAEYRIGTTETKAVSKELPPLPPPAIPGIEAVEVTRYGIAKPRRIVIRAKIVHDQD